MCRSLLAFYCQTIHTNGAVLFPSPFPLFFYIDVVFLYIYLTHLFLFLLYYDCSLCSITCLLLLLFFFFLSRWSQPSWLLWFEWLSRSCSRAPGTQERRHQFTVGWTLRPWFIWRREKAGPLLLLILTGKKSNSKKKKKRLANEFKNSTQNTHAYVLRQLLSSSFFFLLLVLCVFFFSVVFELFFCFAVFVFPLK